MSEPSNITLFGDFGPAAKALVEKCAKGIGGLFGSWQVRRTAKAEAEAAVMLAETQLKITELNRRAVERMVYEESRRQANMEAITQKALPGVSEQADPQQMDDAMTGLPTSLTNAVSRRTRRCRPCGRRFLLGRRIRRAPMRGER